jgi:hypothetical protein
MSPSRRPDTREPFLILSPEEYRRFLRPEPFRRKAAGWTAAAILLIAVAGGAVVGIGRGRPPLPPARAVEARESRAIEASPIVEPPAPARPAIVPPPAVEEEESPEPALSPAAPAEQRPWHGGRAWVRFRLRIESPARVLETEHRVTLCWDGAQFILERTSSRPGELWMDRLDLLLRLSAQNDGWQRHVTFTGTETLHVESGDLSCRRVDGEDRFPQGLRRFRYWYAEEFRAGAVQAEQTVGETRFICRVLDFGPAESDRKADR